MRLIENIGLRALHRMDPEEAHLKSLKFLNSGFLPIRAAPKRERLAVNLAGLELLNPIGLAAGFDKNAEAVDALSRVGFGFIEVGAATPRPQPGNDKPRLFRLSEDKAVINRFGFNNDGMEAIAARLAARKKSGIVGLNLGANKDSDDRSADYSTVLRHCGNHIDFATVNVSSPNTEKLRELQGPAALTSLLNDVMKTRDGLEKRIPIFLKIAPDLGEDELPQVATVARHTGVDAIIATNTTLSRDGLRSEHKDEQGGLSGAPLFEKSTRVLARIYALTEGQIPLIGVGGVGSPEEAYEKIRAGATAVQLYSAMVYEGISLIPRIVRGLDKLLERDGYESVADAIGSGLGDWA